MNQQCKVCGEPAAGFHFGAFTCEGCKSFFGRTYNNLNSIAECKNNRECVINKKNRTSCKACRLRKCFMVGMSKSGSRYGRRSNWFKIHCLLQEQSNNNNNNNNNDSSVMGTGGSGGGPGGGNNRAEAMTAVATAFFGSGAGLYPGAFFPSHLLGVPSAPQRNGFHQQQLTSPENRRREDDIPPHTPSPEESIGSSIGDLGDETSRPASALSFLRPPSTHHSTSPFSGSEDLMYQHHSRKLPTPSALALPPVSPLGGSSSAGSPYSTTSVFPHQRPTSTPPSTRLLYPVLSPPFSATRPGLTPVNGKPLHLDPIRGGPTGGDLLLYSPALAGVAVEQDQPIDLSVKSSLADRSKDKQLGSPHRRASGEDDTGTAATENTERTCKENTVNPLDLTNKRPAEVPQSG